MTSNKPYDYTAAGGAEGSGPYMTKSFALVLNGNLVEGVLEIWHERTAEPALEKIRIAGGGEEGVQCRLSGFEVGAMALLQEEGG